MLLLKGGVIVNNDRKFKSDILIENDTIRQIGINILPTSSDTKVIDVANKLLIPGGIDPMTDIASLTSLNDQVIDDTKSLLIGGTTTIINRIKKEELVQIHQKQTKSFCNYGYFVQINSDNDSACEDMEECSKQLGVNCFEILVKDSKITKNLLAIVQKSKDLHCVLRLVHDTDHSNDLIREACAGNDVAGSSLELDLCHQLQHLYIVRHLPHAVIMPTITNEETAQLLAKYKGKGFPIITEVNIGTLNTNHKLVSHLGDGTIDLLSSQSRTTKDQSKQRIRQLWLSSVMTGIIDECQMVSMISSNSAKYFNLYPKRGYLAIDSVADIAIWNTTNQTIDCVIVKGQLKLENAGQITGNNTNGSRVDLPTHCSFVDEKVKRWSLLQSSEANGSVMVGPGGGEAEEDSSVVDGMTVAGNGTNNKANTTSGPNDKEDINKYKRPPTSSGNRNMQESSFTLSGAQIDDNRPNKSTIRTNQPPGGKSSILF